MISSRLLVAPLLLVCVTSLRAAEVPLTFEKDVRPILKAACFQCHGEEEKPKGKLDVRLVRLLQAGGKGGPAIVPGKPDESPLWERVEADEMPEGPKKLTAAQKATLKLWIEQGAKTAGPEPADAAAARYTADELAFWAWQPVHAGSGRSIDEYLLAKLKEKGVAGFSPEADRRTLIRRVTFDLTGLPPTPAEVAAFLKDTSPDAYGKVVDRLLASPHYGERWGRHWLDVAGFAETDGNPAGLDHPRPHAWKYRDYVVKSLNADKPFDRFLTEQIAGDELAARPLKPSDPATAELLIATGFLRMPPDATESSETLADRNQAAADVVKVVGSAVLGLTVGCAQCHDHRYDPVTQEDYHRLRAVFDPAFDLKSWQKPTARSVDATTVVAKWRAAVIENRAKALEAEMKLRRRVLATFIYGRLLAKTPEAERAALAKALALPPAKLTDSDKALLLAYPSVKPVPFIDNGLEEYDKPAFFKFEAQEKVIEALRATKPPTDLLMVPGERPGYAGESHLFFRGDPDQPKEAVKPGEVFVVARSRGSADIPAKDPTLPTTGRRLALARRLTDGTHPLTARVIVNRMWLHHFGKGLVNTPGDFGLNGERPSHPELLDALADGFVKDGWSAKRLHKRLVTTAAYRHRSTRTPELDKLDPDNRLLGRMSVRRLEAEAVRDALLAVTGQLNEAVGGPSVPVTEDTSGRGVLGTRFLSIFGKPYGPLETPTDAEARRRSLYVTAHRTMPLSMLETFDLPVMSPNCDARKCSTVPPQSLLFLNDETVVKQGEALMERLNKEAATTPERVKLAFALLYAVEPTPAELELCEKFVATQTDYFRTHGDAAWLANVKKWPHAPELRGLSALCQTLLAANRFLYVD